MTSFIRTLNKKGPITDLWRTPDVMGLCGRTYVPNHHIFFFNWIDNFLTTSYPYVSYHNMMIYYVKCYDLSYRKL